MTTEDRLRDALHGEAAQIEPREGWMMIESRLSKAVPRNRTRLLGVAAAAALVLVAAVAVMMQQDDNSTPVITEPDTTSTTETPTTSSPTSTTGRPTATTAATATATGPHEGVLWSHSFPTAREAATTFARDFLNMPSPSVGEFQQGDSRSGEVVIRAKSNRGPTTTLVLRQIGQQWYVLAANAANLELDTPRTDARIASPVHLSGRSIAFEGQVQVAVLRYDTTLQCTVPTDACGSDPGVYANTFFTGHGSEKAPFETDVTFTKPQTQYGYVVLWTNSAEDGSVSEATVRLIRFS